MDDLLELRWTEGGSAPSVLSTGHTLRADPSMHISSTEADYVALGASSDFRADGRHALEFRDVIVESHLVPSVSGMIELSVMWPLSTARRRLDTSAAYAEN